MSMIILPKAGEPGGAAQAKEEFQAALADDFTVILIVYGELPDVERPLEIATARAAANPAIRRVVWCQDPAVLTAQQRQDYFDSDAIAVSVGLADKLAYVVQKKFAEFRSEYEKAFLTAEAQ
jgi:hypothetical protein